MCLKKYVMEKVGEFDCRRQLEDAVISDWCYRGNQELKEEAEFLIEKQEKEDKSLYYKFLFWYFRTFLYK
jgi:hypothetical protein